MYQPEGGNGNHPARGNRGGGRRGRGGDRRGHRGVGGRGGPGRGGGGRVRNNGNGGRGDGNGSHAQEDNQNGEQHNDATVHGDPRGGRKNRQPFERKGPAFGFKRLHGFLSLSSDEVILSITKDSKDWEEFLKSEDVKPSNQRNNLHLVMQVLAEKITGETILQNQQVEICIATMDESFRKNVTDQCTQISMSSSTRSNPRFGNFTSEFTEIDKSPEAFLRNLVTYCEFMLKKMPELSLDFLNSVVLTAYGAVSLRLTDPVFVPLLDITLRDSFQNLIEQLKSRMEKLETQRLTKDRFSSRRRQEFTEDEEKELHAMEAPEDFKEISIIPTVKELMSKEEIFLRPNIIKGAYINAEHYLDVQFRLLREDFVRPLKEGVQDFMKHRSDYLSKKRKIPIGTIRIYLDAQIVGVELVRDITIYKVQLGEDNYKKIRWDKSKRLLTGSMLVFTSDLFKTAFFATVATRNLEELKKGIVSILWEGEGPVWDRDDEYLMVECEVYFEAYRHSLQTLKELELQTFPMCKFIVEASSDVGPPKYLETATCMMKMVLKDGHEKHFSPLVETQWPNAEDLDLDTNQFTAFQAAMTKEFAIIQGPPGTGKTFLGLRIAETLLINEDVWKSLPGIGPILVVCYTNHALDQFLEGIVDIHMKTTGGEVPIVRVGGRCQSEKLNEYTLANIARRKRHIMPKHFWANKSELLSEIDDCRNRRSTIMDAILALRNLQGIVNFERLVVWSDLAVEFSTAVWKCFQSPNWFGLTEESFRPYNFKEDDLIRELFEIREVSKGNVRKVIDRNQSEATTRGPNKNNSAVVEESDDEDYDVDDLLQHRLVDDVFAEVDTKKEEIVSGRFLTYVAGISIYNSDKDIKNLYTNIAKIREDMKNPNRNQIITKFEKELRIIQNRRNFLDRLFTYYRSDRIELPDVTDLLTELRASRMTEVVLQRIPRSKRWALYLAIVDRARVLSAERAAVVGKELIQLQKKLREVQRFGDGWILQNSKVVGMTTTGAAKYNDLLKMMHSKIVIVEEAAEVLEAHIVTCITRVCEHLILIGDHRQLRPSPTVYELGLKFNLNISLFERMIINKLNCYQLKVQHRMRPEIANLVVGTIYPELINYQTVYMYPPVLGVKKNLFFISHSELEKSESDSLSKSNQFEAKYLAAFCRYLILQGYGPERVTVLTTYLGQMFLLKKLISEIPNCRGIRVTCVDNFQGEENDIILLSLVRSNLDSKIGFLSIENRVCVAVSRARHGLFIIGNMGLLSAKSKTWSQLEEKFEARKEIGNFITLECQIHGTETRIQNGNDFQVNAPEGGCRLICDTLLDCNHRCPKVCHIKDRVHETYDCRQDCVKSCINDHSCQYPCFRKPCPPCPVVITKSLPQCGHEVPMPCYQDPKDHMCTIMVLKKLPCGHETQLPCHKDAAEYTCKIKMNRVLRCAHERILECHDDTNLVTCKIIVEKELPCGHKQNAECHVLPEVIKCQSKVEKLLVECKHKMEVFCSDSNKTVTCKNNCSIRLNCGHSCTKLCHISEDPMHLSYVCKKNCSKKCTEGHLCAAEHKCHTACPPCVNNVSRHLPCGHSKDLPCHVDSAQHECLEICPRMLNCLHKCQNLCFENCGPCQIPVKKKIYECGHVINIECHVRPTPDMCIELVRPHSLARCGHNVLVPCRIRLTAGPDEIMTQCKNPCDGEFRVDEGGCGHKCQGTCSSCLQERFHEKCKEKCGRTLVCGDICNFPCSVACPPCNLKCSLKCEHSECGQKCGTPCSDCSERCPWSCTHKVCSKLCRELCDREPCNEPCTKLLPCGHLCIGFCGEPCPPHCRVCDKEHLTEEFFLYGTEGEEDARFVFLPDCKHSIEVEGLSHHMAIDDSEEQKTEVMMKRCPRCQTVIRYCRRFNNLIRKRLEDVVAVKLKMFGNTRKVDAIQKEVVQKLRWDDNQRWSRNFQTFHDYILNEVVDIIPFKVQRGNNAERWIHKPVSESKMTSINFLVGCAEGAIDILIKSGQVDGLKPDLHAQLHGKYRQLFTNIQNRQLPLSQFEIRDIDRELQRLFDLYQAYLRQSNPRFSDGHSVATPLYRQVLAIVEEPKPYTGQRKLELHNLLKQLEDVLKTGLGVSEMERKQIMSALKENSPGRWFKCKNGHYYMIGDCGGAMVEARCPEAGCGGIIGGANHAVRRDNLFAPEVDGARAPLWPNQNLNY